MPRHFTELQNLHGITDVLLHVNSLDGCSYTLLATIGLVLAETGLRLLRGKQHLSTPVITLRQLRLASRQARSSGESCLLPP